MPELPDVETFRRYFDATSLQKQIKNVEVREPRILDNISPEELQSALHRRKFLSSRRYGKNFFAQTDGHIWLTVHFGMSGFFSFFQDLKNDTPHDRCLIAFSDGGYLAYDNQRMIGRIGLAKTPEEYVAEKNLGPDALSIGFDLFRERLDGSSAGIKQTLMNQELVAGVGNIYSDEILFQARIHPETKAKALGDEAWQGLYRAMSEVLKRAIESGADASKMPESFLLPSRTKKGRCPRCSQPLQQMKTGGRTAYYCANCQS